MASYLIAGCRTPIGKFQGSLAPLAAPQLAAVAIREAVARAAIDPAAVDEVVVGHVVQAGAGQAPARQAALLAGLPAAVPAVTVNKVCGSGLKAVMLADQAIRAGDARVVVAGGMESMSRAPYLLPGARMGWRFGQQQALDALVHDGLWCATEQQLMGSLAERTAARFGISREAQDALALESHRRAIAARAAGTPAAEIVPIDLPSGAQRIELSQDEIPRGDTTPERLAKLPPIFDPQGTVTAGNSSALADGAAAVVVADESTARAAAAPWRARIVATAAAAVAPAELFVAPVPAVRAVLTKAGMQLDQIDLVELNEAFAAQVLACQRQLDLDPARLNVAGGAIALGHPIGCSGTRVLVTLLHQLAARNLRTGLAALCLGGGGAVAMIVERE